MFDVSVFLDIENKTVLINLFNFETLDYLKEKVVPLILWLLDESASKESGKEFQLKTKSCELIGRFAYELKGTKHLLVLKETNTAFIMFATSSFVVLCSNGH